VTVKASEFKALQQMVSKLSKENRIAQTKAKVSGMLFSETNKSSVILPANLEKIVEFSVSLSEQQEAKFLEILGSLKPGDARLFGEFGS
jgi:predicted flavoprotein YhiN